MLVDEWDPEVVYLNTASFGLPPRSGFAALESALGDWRAGRVTWEPWCDSTERARAAFARMHRVSSSDVATGATTSELVALVAAALPDGASVLLPTNDFASLTLPWTAHGRRGVSVRAVPLEDLADSVDEKVYVVAFSVVRSDNGIVADVESIVGACRAANALVVVDVTQAAGWLPLDLSLFDFAACSGYKWLLSPRGTAYAYVGERLRGELAPLHANWYAGEEPFASYYGFPSLAAEARRFDTSPAWFSWVGAAPALELLEATGIDRIGAHNVTLANRFRAGVGLQPSESPIVSVAVGADAGERLRAAGIQASTRAGALRASFHLYNSDADVDAALGALSS